MKKGYLLLIIFLLVGFTSSASEKEWKKGVVVLKSTKVLVGQMKYISAHDLVQVKDDNKVRTYSAHQVVKFDYYDPDLELHRKFISLPFQKSTSRFVDSFFEVVIRDEIKLLRKADQYAGGVSRDLMDLESYQQQHALTFNYFYEYDGAVISTGKFKKYLQPELELLTNGKVSKFIQKENLNTHETYDQILVVRFFNKLISDSKEKDLATIN